MSALFLVVIPLQNSDLFLALVPSLVAQVSSLQDKVREVQSQRLEDFRLFEKKKDELKENYEKQMSNLMEEVGNLLFFCCYPVIWPSFLKASPHCSDS
jgi:hypothetical protein